MKKRNRWIAWSLIFVLACSTVSASAAVTGSAASAKGNKMKVTLTTRGDEAIGVKWSKEKGYTGYAIYRKAAGGKAYKKIAAVKGNTYTDKGLKKNTLYKYKIRPYRYIKGKKSYGKYSAVRGASSGVNVKNFTLKLSLPSAEKKGIGIEVVTADRSSNKTAVLLYRSTDSAGPYERVKGVTKTAYRDTAIEGDTTYYYKFKIRKTIGKNNFYSKMSSAKMVRTMPDWTLRRLTYSNLSDSGSRKETADMLRSAGIAETYIQELMALAEDYSQVVGEQPFFHDGFTTIDGRSVNYDGADTYSLWMEKRNYADVNCRLTAMTLFRDHITTGKPQKADDFLAMDTDAMENYPLCKIDGADRAKFYTLFNPVSVKSTTDSAAMLKAVQKEWKNRGISFKSGAASMVSVLCYDELDQRAFVGHTGIMVQADDAVFFIEKIAASSPYQVSRFQSRSEVREYLLDKYWNFYAPGVSAPPVIMENDGELVH